MAKLMHSTQARSAKSIPIAKPLISDEDKRAVLDVLDSGMLVAGRQVTEFEQAFARYLGAREAVATSSGTSALQVALEAAGIGRGDVVVTTPFTFVATGNAILYVGARPVFVDVDPRSYNIDPQGVADAVKREHARAILCVHLYGLACDMAALGEVARSTGTLLIEDCAQAHGAQYADKKVGTFGHAGVFSFYPSKNMTTGEGGMIVTNDPALAERARVLVNVGQRGGAEYLYDAIGYNYRMTNMAGAMGRTQLTHLDDWNKARRDHATQYTAAFARLPWLIPPVEPPGYFHVYNQYTIRVPQGRAQLLNHLSDHQIGRRIYYPHLVPQSPAYQRLGFAGTYPVAERLTAEVVSLPVHPALSGEDVSRILDVVARFPGARE
jgi:perosamine synthetase